MGEAENKRNALIQDLVDTLPNTIEALQTSVTNINTQIDYITDDWHGVSAVMSVMTTASDAWITTKAETLSVDFIPSTWGGYGTANLTQWHIYDSTVEPKTPGNPAYVQYSDSDVTSGAPSASETKQYNRQIDFPQALDHINHDIGLDGTYGILDKITNLNRSKNLVQTNLDAYQTFHRAYERNAP